CPTSSEFVFLLTSTGSQLGLTVVPPPGVISASTIPYSESRPSSDTPDVENVFCMCGRSLELSVVAGDGVCSKFPLEFADLSRTSAVDALVEPFLRPF
ncbi:hypothetical protein M758_12G119700, partial [Ceratodon purpureus]